MTPRVIVLGDCNPDLVLRGGVRPEFGQVERLVSSAELMIGGSASITCCGLARLGLDAGLVARVGDDALGRLQLKRLADAGVRTGAIAIDPDRATGISVVLAEPDDRATLTALGAIGALAAADVEHADLAGADHVHVSSLWLLRDLRPDLPRILGAARRAGVTVSLDTNWDPAGEWTGLDDLLREVDVLLPNLEEARRLSGADDAAGAAAALAERVPTVAIKLGAEGAIAVSGGETVTARAPAVDVVDTTGAGDSFNAGLIAGRLAGRPAAAALALAVACGTLSTRAAGGTAAQPRLAEAEAALAAP